jgi:hypothetical protein
MEDLNDSALVLVSGYVPAGIAVIKMDSFPDVSLDVSFHRTELNSYRLMTICEVFILLTNSAEQQFQRPSTIDRSLKSEHLMSSSNEEEKAEAYISGMNLADHIAMVTIL